MWFYTADEIYCWLSFWQFTARKAKKKTTNRIEQRIDNNLRDTHTNTDVKTLTHLSWNENFTTTTTKAKSIDLHVLRPTAERERERESNGSIT